MKIYWVSVTFFQWLKRYCSKLLHFFLSPIHIFFLVVFVVFIPSTMFLGNINEFMVDYIDYIPVIFSEIIICILILTAIEIILIKIGIHPEWVTNILFSLSLSAWIQVNFLNKDLPLLNGGTMKWNCTAWYAIISDIVWIVLCILPFIIELKNQKLVEKIKEHISVFLSLVLLMTVAYLAATTDRTVQNQKAATTEGEFELANKLNVIVFVIDTLDSTFVDKYIISDDKYDDLFDGFVYYDNVVSGGAPTSLGIPALLTGTIYEDIDNMSYDEYYKYAYESSPLFGDLNKANIATKLYIDVSFLNHANTSSVQNIKEGNYSIGNKLGFAVSMSKFTAFCSAPYPLKNLFMLYTRDITQYIDVEGYDLYKIVDSKFYSDFCDKGLTIGEDDKAFILYHFFGAHPPYVMDENARPTIVNSNEESLPKQIHGCCKILEEYFNELKELDVYDNSMIIVMGDHGGIDLYQNPAVLVKYTGNNQSEDVIRDSSPATFKNVYATIAETLLRSATKYDYGYSLTENRSYYNNEGRVHTTSMARYLASGRSNKSNGDDFIKFQIIGDAKNPSSVYEPSIIGKILDPGKISYYAEKGFSENEGDHIWTDGKEAVLKFNVKSQQENIYFRAWYKTYNGNQRVKLYVNDNLLEDYIARGEEDRQTQIPQSLIKNGELVIRYELPDACIPISSNGDVLGERNLALDFKNIMIYEDSNN